MKANEIMIGDYLSYKGQIIKVASITKKKVGYHIKDNEHRMHYARLCECEPVFTIKEGRVMKAKEAPEKLYLLSNGLISYCRNTDEDVEYTRTDAFIEKAEKYLTEKFIKDVSVLAGGVVSINFDAAISNFINYMKGE